MARLARADLVDPNEVAVFHCIHRCVRRAFLCGDDPYDGKRGHPAFGYLSGPLRRQLGMAIGNTQH